MQLDLYLRKLGMKCDLLQHDIEKTEQTGRKVKLIGSLFLVMKNSNGTEYL